MSPSRKADPPEAGYAVLRRAAGARPHRADGTGDETEVPMNDLVEVGIFAPGDGADGRSEPLYLERHRVRSGRQTITVTVPSEPERAGIDPRRKLIQRDRDDNLVRVEPASG